MNREITLTGVKMTCCEKDCPDRSAGCHGKCERYKAFRAECDTWSETRRAVKLHEREMDTYAKKAAKRLPGKRSF